MWIFGYGSLVWRPDIPFAERSPARVQGWERRFWQGSTDHRGVPEAPGRVVTLIASPGAECWGMAYRLRQEDHAAVLARLDHREQGGYERLEVDIELVSGRRHTGLVYLATPANRNYLGPAPLERIASQVRGSCGPSGSNVEYVLRLAGGLRDMGAHDAHVFELASLLTSPLR